MEEKLIQSEELFRKAFFTSPDSVNINRLSDGLYVMVNEGFTNITGYSSEETIGKTSLELEIWVDQDLRDNLISGLRTKGKVSNLETRFKMKDGTIRDGIMSAAVIDLNGVPHILSITRDITERKKTENALKESETRYREIIELAVDGILVGAADGTIIIANSYMVNLTGRTPDQLLGSYIENLFPPEELEKHPLRYDLLKKGEIITNERQILCPDGRLVPIEMHTKMMPDGTYQSIYHDITERLKAEKEIKVARDKAEASDRLKTSFLNNISHEVRTPLNGILGFADIISHNDLSDSEKQEALSMVNESSNRLLETITNYMDRSLLVSGEMVVNKTDFSPESYLKDFLEKYQPFCSVKNLELVLDLPELLDKPVVNSDPELIQKIFNHLLDNAVKFTEKGNVHFGFKKLNNLLEFYVHDTGIGIGQESINSIFDNFVKEETKARSSEGSGLGLSIAKDLVDLLGGQLKVESEKGIGSRFYFIMPIVEKKQDKTAGEEFAFKNDFKRLSSILVAEDDDINFLYLKTLLLMNTSAQIIHAINGREAVEMFGKNPGIDLVLMDMKMPEVDGFEATRRIKLINPVVPVIAITAYAMLGDENRILESGCDGYLSKPINKERLMEKIAELVKT